MYRALGLDDLDARLYDRLLDVTAQSDTDLATDLGLPLDEVLAALTALEGQGLVSRSVVHPGRVTATPPDVGLGTLLADRRAELARGERLLPVLTERFRAVNGARDGVGVVDVVHGPEAVEQRFTQLRRSATREVLDLAPPVPAPGTVGGAPPEDGLTGTVEHRMVVSPTALTRPGYVELLRDRHRRGEQVRVVEFVPLRLSIADRELALLTLHDPGDAETVDALLVRRSGLLDALVTLFELVWQGGRPLTPAQAGDPPPARATGGGDGTALDDLDRRVIGLLLAGLTDDSIGRQLGLSLRTVQRRVRALMDLAGVSTRLQLGHEIGKRGWS